MNNNRNKAWRQAKRKSKEAKFKEHIDKQNVPEKNWKLMYIRSEKLKRAQQLGIEYPPRTLRQKLDDEMPLEGKK